MRLVKGCCIAATVIIAAGTVAAELTDSVRGTDDRLANLVRLAAFLELAAARDEANAATIVTDLQNAPSDQVRDALATQTFVEQSITEPTAGELPREWRWERRTVEFDHMYRQQDSPRLDWIRESSSR